MNEIDARNYCGAQGGSLLTIDSQEQQDRVRSSIGNNKAWLAYKRDTQYSEWKVVVDNSHTVRVGTPYYSNWDPQAATYQPTNPMCSAIDNEGTKQSAA
eukprot:5890685-Prymnesium_polylepis.1